MSKDIWHKADEAPRYRFQCIYYHRDSKEYYFGEYDATFRVFLGKKTFHQDEAWKFAFAEDVIACLDELERTRKALEIAVDALKRANNTYCVEEEDATIDLTESAAHKWQRTAYQMEMPISIALEQITELEQKDVK